MEPTDRRRILTIFIASLVLLAEPARGDSFDPTLTDPAELELIELGLVQSGDSFVEIDGVWTPVEQERLGLFASRWRSGAATHEPVRGRTKSAPSPDWRDAGLAAAAGLARIRDHGLARRESSDLGVSVIAKPGSFERAHSPDFGDYLVWRGANGGDDVVIMSLPRDVMESMHDGYADGGRPAVPGYLGRDEAVWFTAVYEGPDIVFLLSVTMDDGRWLTALYYDSGADDRLNALIAIRSITTDTGRSIGLSSGSRLAAAVGYLLFPSFPSPPEKDFRQSVGTAFFISPTHAVTAEHVVRDCADLKDEMGETFWFIDADEDADVAIVGSSRPSGQWLRLAPFDSVRLGDAVRTIGYPSYGRIGTAQKFSSGHVAAVRGIDDRKDQITITVPVNPGNSGGPLLNEADAVVGVVTGTFGQWREGVDGEAEFLPDQSLNAAASWSALFDLLARSGAAYELSDQASRAQYLIDESITGAVFPLFCARPEGPDSRGDP